MLGSARKTLKMIGSMNEPSLDEVRPVPRTQPAPGKLREACVTVLAGALRQPQPPATQRGNQNGMSSSMSSNPVDGLAPAGLATGCWRDGGLARRLAPSS